MLTAVTEARASATRVTVTPDQLTDPAAMQRFAEAQKRRHASSRCSGCRRLIPSCTANENFMALHVAARRHREPDQHRPPRL